MHVLCGSGGGRWMDGWMGASARWECERERETRNEKRETRNEKRETRNENSEGWGFVYFFVCLFTSFHIDWVISSLATYYYIVTLSAMKSGGLLISAVRN
ncbi:hypothetical protein BofuT4_P070490.1 [Botrytis cinerea T4]|uniref:Uncharacterized protein n=1 Tax=Botryotinia fuckeliana (strain T4) TaxID=999810 RepID=G2XQ85_BOTF4|nr:hypothetical protein BofuT4_P070490.1 [Botrytis cinerea T4]